MKRFVASVFAMSLASQAFALGSFELRDMNSNGMHQTYRSSDHPQAIFVLEAFFYACPYCHQNAPMISSIVKDFAHEPRVQVLDIGRDCRASDYARWLDRTNPSHPVLNDCNQQVLSQMNVRGFPTTVIYDCNGRERLRHVGAMNSSQLQQAKRLISSLLNETC